MGDCISWCNPVFKRVEALPDLDYATRNHAYIMPDNKAYILNENGDGFTELTSTATTGGTSYDDKPLVARVEKLEAKEDRDTVYDDTELKKRVSALETKEDSDKQTLTLSGTTLSISNGNSVEIPKGTTYKAGNGITITEDGTINNSVVDTNTKYRLKYNVTGTPAEVNFTSLNPQPSNYPLAPNTMKVTGINHQDVLSASELVVKFPKITYTISGSGFAKSEKTNLEVELVIPVTIIGDTTLKGYGTLTTPYSNINISFEVRRGEESYFAFSFDFFKLDIRDSLNVLPEPMLNVPMSIDNITKGIIFGANFADEFIIETKVAEPTLIINQLYYTLEEVSN